jgi:hypothetical protein
VLFTTDGGKPSERFIEIMRKNRVKHGYAVQVVEDDYSPFIKQGSFIICDPYSVVEEGDHVFVRLREHSDILATFKTIDNGTYFFDPITPDSPVDPKGYPDDEVISVHYIDGIENPKK